MAFLTIMSMMGVLGILFLGFNLMIITLLILTIVFGVSTLIKKKFKKTFITLLIITISLGIIDFFLINNLLKEFNEMSIGDKENILMWQEDDKVILTDNPIKQLFMSEDEKIEIICNDIINKIKTKDYETIKSIFSKDMINNVQDLDKGVEQLINISNENIIDFKPQMNGSETHWDKGKHRKTLRFSMAIETNNKTYDTGFDYDYENPFNSDTLGVNRMVILDENENILVLVDNEAINKGY